MSRIQEIRQELEKIAERVAILGREVNEIESKPIKPQRWYSPEECNCYWDTISGLWFTKDEFRKKDLVERFEAFPTKEDAEYYREIPRLLRPLAKALRELNDGWWPDWIESCVYPVWSPTGKKWFGAHGGRNWQMCHSALTAKDSPTMEQALEIAQLDPPL